MSQRARLYLITPPVVKNRDDFLEQFKQAIDGGDVACLQIRLKPTGSYHPTADDILYLTETVQPIAGEHDIAVIINDRPDLVIQSGADGVHLGQGDAPYKNARAMLGDDVDIGVTCHNSRHLAIIAGEAGADYVAFGAFFPTATKDAPTRATPEILEWWSFATTVPCVSIGGITPENCTPLVRAGADFLAASSSVWDHEAGPRAAVEAFNRAIAAATR